MWAGEMAAIERARHRIARQGPRPGFLFGAAAFGYAKSDEYARQYGALLNYGTVPFYRAATERVEGSPDYRNVDAILEKMAGTQIITKGHPLVWFHRAGISEFLKTKSWDELKRSCREYILRSVGRFRSRIHAWDVINEAHDWANELGFNQDQLLEITRLAAESTRVADPTAFRVVNCCLPWGEYVATGRTYAGPLKRPARTPLEYYRAVEDARVPYEAVGIQVYYPGQDMLEMERQLERFFVFGKPIHITELGVPSSSEGVKGGGALPYENVWHGTRWSEQIQADWAEQFYTICYSKPEIQAISWWTFSDSSERGGSGLMRSGFRPKLSYQRLAKLLASWKEG
jgi:GH35 family endo-1,4-beta-xylanase